MCPDCGTELCQYGAVQWCAACGYQRTLKDCDT